jgi:hypothetical protein
MRVKVLKRFRDKHTHEYHEVGKVLVISKERYEEICAVDNTLVEVKETAKKK